MKQIQIYGEHSMFRFILGISVCLCAANGQQSNSLFPYAMPLAQSNVTISLTASAAATPAATGGYAFTAHGTATFTGHGFATLSGCGTISDVHILTPTI